jgi:hypothetical protein
MVIVRNIQNNQLYGHLGDNKYINLVTGVEGEVPDDMAKKIFKINLQATKIVYDFPVIQTLISELGLTIDNNN